MKKIILLAFIYLFSFSLKSQCTANFSVSIGSNGSVSFTDLSSGISANATYVWHFGDGQDAYYVNNPSHIYGGNGTYSITLLISDSTNNCTANVTQTLALSNVSCNVSASMNFSVSNAYVTFYNTSTGTIPGTSYDLDLGNGLHVPFFNNSFLQTSYSYTASGTYTVILTVTNSSVNCLSTYTTVVTVNIPPCNLNANFTYSVGSGGVVTLNNTSTGTSSTTSYYWFSQGSFFSFQQNPGTLTFLYNGQYVISLTAQDSILSQCTSVNSQTINITGLPCVVNTSFIMAKDSSVTSSIVWNAYATYPGNTSSVTWNWGDGNTSTGFYPSHTYSATGMYNICMTVSVSCGSFTTVCLNSGIYKTDGSSSQMASVNVLDATITGIHEIQKNNVLSIYPNPSKDQVTIHGISPGTKITITDLVGKIVYAELQEGTDVSIDVSGFKSGMYIMKASGSNYSATAKLVKE